MKTALSIAAVLLLAAACSSDAPNNVQTSENVETTNSVETTNTVETSENVETTNTVETSENVETTNTVEDEVEPPQITEPAPSTTLLNDEGNTETTTASNESDGEEVEVSVPEEEPVSSDSEWLTVTEDGEYLLGGTVNGVPVTAENIAVQKQYDLNTAVLSPNDPRPLSDAPEDIPPFNQFRHRVGLDSIWALNPDGTYEVYRKSPGWPPQSAGIAYPLVGGDYRLEGWPRSPFTSIIPPWEDRTSHYPWGNTVPTFQIGNAYEGEREWACFYSHSVFAAHSHEEVRAWNENPRSFGCEVKPGEYWWQENTHLQKNGVEWIGDKWVNDEWVPR